MTPKEFRKSGTHAQQHEWTYYPDKFAEDFANQELDWYIDTCKKQLDESKQLKKDLAYEIKMREGCIKERVVLNKQVEELREALEGLMNYYWGDPEVSVIGKALWVKAEQALKK